MEYWITNSKDYIYCDGDDGPETPNHRSVVIAHCLNKIREQCESSNNKKVRDFGALLECFSDESIIDLPMLSEYVNDWIDQSNLPQSDAQDIYAWLERNLIDANYIAVAFGFEEPDPVNFAIEKLGWIRVKMYDGVCNINCLGLDSQTKKILSEMLLEIFDNMIFRTRLVIETRTSGQYVQMNYGEL